MSQQQFNQTGGWHPNLEGLKLPPPLVRGVEQAYRLIYSLRDAITELGVQLKNKTRDVVLGGANLIHPNVVTKVGPVNGEIVEGGITDESAANSDRVHVTPEGNVGIGNRGITPDAGVTARVHLVIGETNITSTRFGSVELGVSNPTAGSQVGGIGFSNYAITAPDLRIAGIASFTDPSIDSGDLRFSTSFGGTGREWMRLTALGNLGVGGITPPQQRLHVRVPNGNNPATGGTAQGGIVQLDRANGTNCTFFGVQNGPPFSSWIQVSDSTNLGINYPLTLNPNGGNVGCGLLDPLAGLHVNQQIRSNTGYVSVGGAVGVTTTFEVTQGGTPRTVIVTAGIITGVV